MCSLISGRGNFPTGTSQGLKWKRDVMAPLCLLCDRPAQQVLRRSQRTWDPVSKETLHQEQNQDNIKNQRSEESQSCNNLTKKRGIGRKRNKINKKK